MGNQKQEAANLRAPPSLGLALAELRALPELAAGIAALPLLRRGPRGDGHCALVLPGLMASDASTFLLRGLLGSLGHQARGWGLGINMGPRPGLEEAIERLLEEAARSSGRKVSLVGQSLGGSYARLLGARRPDLVRCVVTLGSPSAGDPRSNRAWRLYQWASGRSAEADSAWADVERGPAAPCTSVWSRTDAIVSPGSARALPGPLRECVEIWGSHVGMAVHPGALSVVADRLSQPEGAWTPFESSGWARALFPERARAPGRGVP